jgi:uncharacterized protein with HEPN domain
MSDPAKYSLSNDIFLVRGEAGYLVFIMLKAREACELIQGVTQDSFIASYACRRDVVNCLRDICEAAKRISKQLRNSVHIHWQALDEVILLDWQDANAVWDLATNRLNDLASSIKSLKPVFASNFVVTIRSNLLREPSCLGGRTLASFTMNQAMTKSRPRTTTKLNLQIGYFKITKLRSGLVRHPESQRSPPIGQESQPPLSDRVARWETLTLCFLIPTDLKRWWRSNASGSRHQ